MNHHLTLRRKLLIMLSVMASLLLVALDQTIISTALGKIVEEFNAFSSLSWIVTAYLITTTITVPIAGKLSDLFGRRTLLLVGVAVFTIASLMSGLSGSVLELIIWRAVQGIGGGIITANAFTIVGDLFAARERGRWQGLIGAVFGLSSVVGPLLGGFLTDGHQLFGLMTDWRWTFFINVPVGIVAFIVIALFSPALKHAKKPVIDYFGAVFLTIALAVLIFAVDNTESIFAGFLEATGMSLTALRVIMGTVVVAAVAAFIWTERRAKEPILPLSLFRNHNFVRIAGLALLFGSAFMGSILYLTQFNQQVFGATPTESGLMLLPMVGGIMISSITSGQLISRIGKYKLFMQIGIVVATICVFLLATLGADSTYLQEALIMFPLGLGLGVVMPVMTLALQNEFPQEKLGVVTSSNQLFRSLGSTVGTAIFGSLLTAGIVANLGSMQQDVYIELLSRQPEAAQLGNLEETDTLLRLNMPDTRAQITDTSNAAIATLPASEQEAASQSFTTAQNEFSQKITGAFAVSLQHIFVVAGVMMAIATILVFRIKEQPLRAASADETPGIE